jgi:hypothetical protein
MIPQPRMSAILLAFVGGLVAYLFAFGFIISHPLTVDDFGRYAAYKQRYLASIRSERKIVIFAGSNGRYSHRCETIASVSGIPCANLSIAAGYDMNWQLARYLPYLRSGDVLYMPLEYWPLPLGARFGAEAPYIVRRDHAALRLYRASSLPFVLFYFDLRYLVAGIGEMLLERHGFQRRTSLASLTPQGDERGATPDKAVPYQEYIRSLEAVHVRLDSYDDAGTLRALAALIHAAKSRGVIVVGGLPTTFDDATVPASVPARLREIFEQDGGCFIALPNESLYPRRDFFDTGYHLQEPFQIAHSEALAPLLAQISRTAGCARGGR